MHSYAVREQRVWVCDKFCQVHLAGSYLSDRKSLKILYVLDAIVVTVVVVVACHSLHMST